MNQPANDLNSCVVGAREGGARAFIKGRRRTVRRRLAVTSLVVLSMWDSASGLPADASAAVTDADLCFGQAPTIVGTPAGTVAGTEGPDVVVTNGAFKVQTLGGRDLVCVTGAVPALDPPVSGLIDTGEGDDRIDATGGVFPYLLTIHPGRGDDEVLAGPHQLTTGEVAGVWVDATDGPASHPDADTIWTGDGPDNVEAGAGDSVHLGGGDDTLTVTDQGDLSDAVFDGGEGLNSISLTLWPPFWHLKEHHAWKIDNRAGRLARDGKVASGLVGFTIFDLQVRGPLKFLGSDRDEVVYSASLPPEEAFGHTRHHWPIDLDMGAGDDIVAYHRGGADSRFDGGDGRDRFAFVVGRYECYCSGDPVKGFLDLSAGVLRYIFPNGQEVRTSAVHFENVRWWSRADGTIIGTAGPNKLVTRYHKPGRDMTMLGKGGDDYLRGGLGKDVLIGGRGHDVADGQGGDLDRCSAEVRLHCES